MKYRLLSQFDTAAIKFVIALTQREAAEARIQQFRSEHEAPTLRPESLDLCADLLEQLNSPRARHALAFQSTLELLLEMRSAFEDVPASVFIRILDDLYCNRTPKNWTEILAGHPQLMEPLRALHAARQDNDR